MKHLRAVDQAAETAEPATAEPAKAPGEILADLAAALHSALRAASREANCRLSAGTYVRPHLVRKLLLRHCYSTDGIFSVPMTWSQFAGLGLPDQSNFMSQLPEEAQDIQILEGFFKCPALLAACFLCLAGPALKKRPSLLRELDATLISDCLRRYQEVHGFPPSLERLFTWQPDSCSSPSAAESCSENLSATESDRDVSGECLWF